jgi:hypothetical protein
MYSKRLEHGGANGATTMEFRDHYKNGASPKSHTSKGNVKNAIRNGFTQN